jgi:hypothetical protein
MLKNNITAIVKNIDTDGVRENEIFYVYKDKVDESFKVFT